MTRWILLPLLFAITACSGDTTGKDTDETDVTAETDAVETDVMDTEVDAPEGCTEANTLCVEINVPADYAGTPRQLFLTLFETLPPAGPPNAIIGTFGDLMLTPGGSASFVATDNIPFTGDYFLSVVLYDEAGGSFQPMSGVDHEAFSATALTFDGDAVDAGTLDLVLSP